jgi:hypothetical protein
VTPPRGLPEIAAFALYAVLLLAGMYRHVLWRDEAEALLIVRDAADLPGLLHTIRYTAHPLLFYLLMTPFQAVLHDVAAVQALQAVCAGAVAALLLWVSPFTRPERLLLPFGAFTLFEYGVKSRSYALGFALLWVACLVLQRRPRRPVLFGATLGLLANMHVLFALLAVALGVAALPEHLAAWRASVSGEPRRLALCILAGAAIFCAGLALAATVAAPPPDSTVGHEASGRTPLFEVLRTLLALSGLVGPNTCCWRRSVWRCWFCCCGRCTEAARRCALPRSARRRCCCSSAWSIRRCRITTACSSA